MRFDPEAEEGNRVVEATREGGERIREDTVYRVAVNNFPADGGDGYTVLPDGRNRTPTAIVDLDALVVYLAGLPEPLPIPRPDRITPLERPR